MEKGEDVSTEEVERTAKTQSGDIWWPCIVGQPNANNIAMYINTEHLPVADSVHL